MHICNLIRVFCVNSVPSIRNSSNRKYILIDQGVAWIQIQRNDMKLLKILTNKPSYTKNSRLTQILNSIPCSAIIQSYFKPDAFVIVFPVGLSINYTILKISIIKRNA